MTDFDVQGVIDLLIGLPAPLAYAVIAAGSALENVFPPVPSDTFLVLGAVLTDRGQLQAVPVLLSAWIANTAGAMFVFGLARRRGPSMFEGRLGRWLLKPHQFERASRFYDRYGLWAIFFSRFLPVLRVVIPTFAGFTGIRTLSTLGTIATASLLWNGLMLWAGIFASQNVGRLLDMLGQANAWLVVVAVAVTAAIVTWWIRSRREEALEEALEEAVEAAREEMREEAASRAEPGNADEETNRDDPPEAS